MKTLKELVKELRDAAYQHGMAAATDSDDMAMKEAVDRAESELVAATCAPSPAEFAALLKRAQYAEAAAFKRLQEAYASQATPDDLARLTLSWSRAAKALLSMAPAEPREAVNAVTAQTLELVSGHLAGLGLAPADAPLEEHARLAADIVRRARHSTQGE